MSQLIKDTNYTLAAFDKVRIVMVGTTEPGNIGAAARAMKNMSLSRLFLVNPNKYPSAAATARASDADDVLSSAVVCSSCLLYTSPSPRDRTRSRMPSSA